MVKGIVGGIVGGSFRLVSLSVKCYSSPGQNLKILAFLLVRKVI